MTYQVTDLRPAVRSENRINVFINGSFDFSLDLSQVVDYHVKVGATFTEDELATLRSASEFSKLYNSTLEWLLARPRSVKETRDHLHERQYRRAAENRARLARRDRERSAHLDRYPQSNRFQGSKKSPSTKLLPEISDDNIAKVLDRLLEKGYLDDVKFARFYVENRYQKKGISPRRLDQELRKKGLSSELIAEALASSPRDESAELEKLIRKKRARYSDDKLKAYLLRQGFSYSAISDALEAYSSTNSETL